MVGDALHGAEEKFGSEGTPLTYAAGLRERRRDEPIYTDLSCGLQMKALHLGDERRRDAKGGKRVPEEIPR